MGADLATPAALAAATKHAPQEALMALLVAGLWVHSRRGEPDALYTELDHGDPYWGAQVLTELFADIEGTYPYTAGHFGPLTEWTFGASSARLSVIRTLAAQLARFDLAECARHAGGDLLGQVRVEHIRMNHRDPGPLDLYTLDSELYNHTCSLNRLAQLHRLGSWSDNFCASGVRLLGLWLARGAVGIDPRPYKYLATDPEPLWVAIAAANLAIAGVVGDDITLKVAPGMLIPGPPGYDTILAAEPGADLEELAEPFRLPAHIDGRSQVLLKQRLDAVAELNAYAIATDAVEAIFDAYGLTQVSPGVWRALEPAGAAKPTSPVRRSKRNKHNKH